MYEKTFENGYNVYTDLNDVAWLEKFHPDHLPPLGKLMFVAILALLLCEMYAYILLLNFVYTDVLLGNTEQSDVPDIQQQQAGPSTPSISENCITPVPLSDKENCAKLVSCLDPVNQEVVRTPVAQKSVDTSQAKVLNSVNCSPLSELLIYQKTEIKK